MSNSILENQALLIRGSLLVAAFAQTGSAALIGLREVLLAPDRPNYPNAERRLRLAMFVLSAALLYQGADQACKAFAAQPHLNQPASVVLATAWFACSALELERTTRQWLPARIQRRFQRLMHLASCGAAWGVKRARTAAAGAVYGPTQPVPSSSSVGTALAALLIEGATVVAPGEGKAQAEIGLHAGFQRLFPVEHFVPSSTSPRPKLRK